MSRAKKATEYLRYNFTPEERLKMGEQLAQSYNQLADVENEEKVAKAQFAERKSQITGRVSTISRQLASGFEMRNVECRLEYDKPNVNEVQYIRIDNGEVVKTRAMLPDEMQEELPLSEGPSEPVVIHPAQAEASAQQSAENISEFFGKQDATAADQPEPIEEPAAEADPRHDGVDGHCGEGCPCIAEEASDAEETAPADEWAEAKPAEESKEATANETAPPNGRRKSGPKDLEKFHQEQLAKGATTAPRRPRGFDKPVNETAW